MSLILLTHLPDPSHYHPPPFGRQVEAAGEKHHVATDETSIHAIGTYFFARRLGTRMVASWESAVMLPVPIPSWKARSIQVGFIKKFPIDTNTAVGKRPLY